MLHCFTVVFADGQQDLQDLEAIANGNMNTNETTTTKCDKCLEVIQDDCEWNEEVIPGSKTDFHFEKSGVCPCPGDDKKDKCNVVQRRVRNIPALQAWSACLFLLSICIAGKILTVLYSIIDTILSSKVSLCYHS